MAAVSKFSGFSEPWFFSVRFGVVWLCKLPGSLANQYPLICICASQVLVTSLPNFEDREDEFKKEVRNISTKLGELSEGISQLVCQ